MMNIIRRIKQIVNVILGFLYKWKYDIIGFDKLPNIKKTKKTPQIIVSLTSYERRVKNVVPYTLASLLNQTMLPDKIILWLDQKNWNISNIPMKISILQKHGIDIRFCQDLRSYKKLVPTLKLYPNDIIITVDDDVIYHKNLIEKLYNAYLTDPQKIYTHYARFPSLDSKNNITPYDDWQTPSSKNYWIMPIGALGVLYPPHCLHQDVTNYFLFQELCPLADDIWFWIMALRQGTSHIVISQGKSMGYGFDILYQYFHKGTNLTFTNRKCGLNDQQLKNICNYFKLNLTEYISIK